MGKKNNQKFLAIPHAKLIDKLNSKCEELWLRCHSQEESYTSKCSFLDRELIKHQEEYKGRRVKRWLFQTSVSVCLNADVNGWANILIKGLQSLKVSAEIITKVYDWVCKGLVNNPVRLMSVSNFWPLNEATT
jgi:putative transposase